MKKVILDNLLHYALEAMPNCVIIDLDLNIVYMNKVYTDLIGATQEEVIGKNVKKYLPNTLLDEIIETGKERIGDIFLAKNLKTGKTFSLITNKFPIYENNKIIGALGMSIPHSSSYGVDTKDEIENLIHKAKLYKQYLDNKKNPMYSLNQIIGKSNAMMQIKATIEKYADTDIPVLITGETGTGKEVIANAFHQLCRRYNENFVKINCAAIPKELLESELFGYEPGAFSGALKNGKIGKFQLADNGTILLDEIGEMPLILQSKLLRILQEKEIEKIGGLKPIKISTRIIGCTNKNMIALVNENKFRKDLYYRMNALEIKIPPLRERVEYIPLLCDFFRKKINDVYGYAISEISKEVIEKFMDYSWPGNIRELQHVMYRASILAHYGTLTLNDFDFFLENLQNSDLEKISFDSFSEETSLKKLTMSNEKNAIIEALKITKGNKSKAAKLLKIDRSRLYAKMKKLDIEY